MLLRCLANLIIFYSLEHCFKGNKWILKKTLATMTKLTFTCVWYVVSICMFSWGRGLHMCGDLWLVPGIFLDHTSLIYGDWISSWTQTPTLHTLATVAWKLTLEFPCLLNLCAVVTRKPMHIQFGFWGPECLSSCLLDKYAISLSHSKLI